MEKISIIVPVYNSEKQLDKCLLSIVNQTYKNIEIICINDGSNDKSAEILAMSHGVRQQSHLGVIEFHCFIGVRPH